VTNSHESDVGEQDQSDGDIENDLDINYVDVTESGDVITPPVQNFEYGELHESKTHPSI
jgi:hypothetical protein